MSTRTRWVRPAVVLMLLLAAAGTLTACGHAGAITGAAIGAAVGGAIGSTYDDPYHYYDDPYYYDPYYDVYW